MSWPLLSFRRIRASELVGQMWTKEEKWIYAPNVLNLTHRFNQVCRLIVREIIVVVNSCCEPSSPLLVGLESVLSPFWEFGSLF